MSATAGYSSAVAALAGVRLPITSHPLQAFVTEPYKPILDRIVASADMLVYISQTSRGEILVGAEIERYNTYSTRSTFSFLAECASRAIDLLPFTARLRILRQWTGVCDMSPDYSPLMGPTEVEGFLVTAGWGTWGFKAIPAGGMGMAELVATISAPSERPIQSALRGERPLGPVDEGQILGEPVGVGGDCSIHCRSGMRYDGMAAALALAVDDLFVGEHGAERGTPVDGHSAW